MLIAFMTLLSFASLALAGIIWSKRRAFRLAYLDDLSCETLPDAALTTVERVPRPISETKPVALRRRRVSHAGPSLHTGLVLR
ncbi:hypothetical protein EPK99_12815 [Neorhizobium lilium]|uniref:Uncharacterized protein n=1 Tax=Neorhizobium lilium TaxID=2503024 RepID=A0A3S3RS21_9HYPH|nr:hypothetical protein [Neorhizobium lilium]RWX76566.1 hypothetical protein EPK99_12815 [Neorhizobium lilium]